MVEVVLEEVPKLIEVVLEMVGGCAEGGEGPEGYGGCAEGG